MHRHPAKPAEDAGSVDALPATFGVARDQCVHAEEHVTSYARSTIHSYVLRFILTRRSYAYYPVCGEGEEFMEAGHGRR